VTDGEGVFACYNDHQQKKTKFLKQKRGKSTVGNILKNENSAKKQVPLT
jgi:hypothetical protein